MSLLKKALFCGLSASLVFSLGTYAKSKTHHHKPLLLTVTKWQDPSTDPLAEQVPNNPPYPWRYYSLPHTNNRLQMALFLNADLTPKLMEKTTAGEEGDYFAIGNGGILTNFYATHWAYAHLGVVYYKVNKGQGNKDKNTGVVFDTAYGVLGNEKTTPWFLRAGIFYLPFGQYNRYALVNSLPSLLTMSDQPAIEVGEHNWHGISSSIYVATGQLRSGTQEGTAPQTYQSTRSTDNPNFGAQLGVSHSISSHWSYQLAGQYMYNLLDTNAFAESESFTADNPNFVDNPSGIYTSPIGGVAAQAALTYRSFTLFGQYVTALSWSSDLINRYLTPTLRADPIFGSKPSAWEAGFRYHLITLRRPSTLYFSYSRSQGTAGLYIFNSNLNHMLPRARYIASYSVFMNHNASLTFMWAHDWLFPVNQGGMGRQGEDVAIRFGLIF